MREPVMTKVPPFKCHINIGGFVIWVILTSGPRRNTRKNWREKEGKEECDSRGHARDTGFRTVSNTSRRFDKWSDRRCPEESAYNNTEGINAVCNRRPLEITRGLVHDTGETRQGVKGTSGAYERTEVSNLLNAHRVALAHDIEIEDGNERQPNLTLAIVVV